MSERPKAVVTGCGALCAFGVGVPAFWRGLLSGRTAVGPIRGFDASGHVHAVAGEVSGFDPSHVLPKSAARRLDRVSQFAMAAAYEALRDADLVLARCAPERVGVIVSSTLGGMVTGEAYQSARRHGRNFPARSLLSFPYYAVAARVARELGVRGPVISPSIACASGTHAVGLALEKVRRDEADVFVVGGAETICPFVVSGFNCLRATATSAAKPFDLERTGLILGEGAAVVIIENAAFARKRGYVPTAEVVGSGLAGDAMHITAPARDGSGAARAMVAALVDAGVAPAEVDFISAHGTGTVYNDTMESEAIRRVFGEAAATIPVNSIKGAIGHTLGAAGVFEALMSVRVIMEGLIPPTTNCERVDPACGLAIVRGEPLARSVDTVVSTSSAFAGNNAAIVLQRCA